MTKSILMQMSTEFAAESLILSQKLMAAHQESISKQFIKAATSIGANIREARYAESKKDFTHKMNIALKECNESVFWLNTVINGKLIDDEETRNLYNKSYDILRMLVATVNKCRMKNLKKED